MQIETIAIEIGPFHNVTCFGHARWQSGRCGRLRGSGRGHLDFWKENKYLSITLFIVSYLLVSKIILYTTIFAKIPKYVCLGAENALQDQFHLVHQSVCGTQVPQKHLLIKCKIS